MNHREFFEHLAETWGNEGDPLRLGEILKHINARRWKRVLDVGTGTGILLPVLDADEIVALDFSRRMLKKAMANWGNCAYFVQGSAQHLPFASCYFDCVICFRSFPHFFDKKKALSEIYRVLRRNSRFYIAHTTSRENLNSMHRRVGRVVANDLIPDNWEMRKMLTDSGFSQIGITDQEGLYLTYAIRA